MENEIFQELVLKLNKIQRMLVNFQKHLDK